jgi:hypothetical protein
MSVQTWAFLIAKSWSAPKRQPFEPRFAQDIVPCEALQLPVKSAIGHGVAQCSRNIFPVKTQRDDGVLLAVSLTTVPLEKRRNMRPVKV